MENTEVKRENDPVEVYNLLGFDNNFIRQYESNCKYEGLSEEKKISKDFTEDDLRKIEAAIISASKAKPKERADYYLTAACIEKELSDRSDKYYEFIANSMLYQGHLLLANRNFDCAKSFYLTSISLSQMTGEGVRIEDESICSYMYSLLKQPIAETYSKTIRFDSEIMIFLPKLFDLIGQDNTVLFDVIRIVNVSRHLKKFFEKYKFQTICRNILAMVMNFASCNQLDDQLWVTISKKYKDAETTFNKWYTEVQLDKNFEHEIEDAATDVIKSLLVTKLDVEYINNYLNLYKEIREYKEYSDFDNRIRILNQGINGIKDLSTKCHSNSTLFFENYMLRIIDTTINNINSIVSRTGEDYKPELSIEVPITNVPSNYGSVSLHLQFQMQIIKLQQEISP